MTTLEEIENASNALLDLYGGRKPDLMRMSGKMNRRLITLKRIQKRLQADKRKWVSSTADHVTYTVTLPPEVRKNLDKYIWGEE